MICLCPFGVAGGGGVSCLPRTDGAGGGGMSCRFQLGAQAGEFGVQGVVFLGLALQVAAGQEPAVMDAFRGEQEGELFELLAAALKAAEHQVALPRQDLEQKVDLADANAQFRASSRWVRWGLCSSSRRAR